MSRQQVRDTQGGVWRLLNLIKASQNWNKIKFVDSQGHQFCFLIVLMPLASWLLCALAKKTFIKTCLVFVFFSRVLSVWPLVFWVSSISFFFLALSSSCGLAIVDSGYVASLPASQLKIVPGVFYAHFSTNKKYLLSHFLSPLQLGFLFVDYLHTSETIHPVHTFILGFYYEIFTWLNVKKTKKQIVSSHTVLLQQLSVWQFCLKDCLFIARLFKTLSLCLYNTKPRSYL